LIVQKVPTKVETYDALDDFGRVRLSKNFFMRDFLYSEIANHYGEPNKPSDPQLAVKAGTKHCTELLEPLNATFGRIAIRSAYRSEKINSLGIDKHSCAKNESNWAGHIWDHLDTGEGMGATACIVIPWYVERFKQTGDCRPLAYWIHDHLPYSSLEFFKSNGLCAFNIGWHQTPKKTITNWIGTPRTLLKNAHEQKGFSK